MMWMFGLVRCFIYVFPVLLFLIFSSAGPDRAFPSDLKIGYFSLSRVFFAHPETRKNLDLQSLSFSGEEAYKKKIRHLKTMEKQLESVERKIEILQGVYEIEVKKNQQKMRDEISRDPDREEEITGKFHDIFEKLEKRYFEKKKQLESEQKRISTFLNQDGFLMRYSDREYSFRKLREFEQNNIARILNSISRAADTVMKNRNLDVVINSDFNFTVVNSPADTYFTNPYQRFLDGEKVNISGWLQSVRNLINSYFTCGERPALLRGGTDITTEIIKIVQEQQWTGNLSSSK